MLRNEERALAIDLFGDQAQNTDRSGKGDKDIFLAHSNQMNVVDRLSIISKPSQSISSEDIRTELQMPARIFSVDGSHVAEIVAIDMHNAENCA